MTRAEPVIVESVSAIKQIDIFSSVYEAMRHCSGTRPKFSESNGVRWYAQGPTHQIRFQNFQKFGYLKVHLTYLPILARRHLGTE